MSDDAARPDGSTLPRCPHCGADHPPQQLRCPDTDLALPLEGRLLHGKFRFMRQLGRGGMAAVWAAVNTMVDRRVAIKLIRPEAGRNEETVARFRAEAKAAGRIGHPNVCEILDYGLGPLGPYIVMERLRGKSLGQLIRDEERLSPELSAAIVRQALAGLEAAHRRGIIHRDLKPENLFIHQPEVGPPVVKIMDFGVSKLTDGSSEVETEHGALLGTPEYMSPEQFRGASRADARTDVWAMGAILYKALTGKTAFAGGSVPGTLLMVTTDEPAPIDSLVRGVPTELVDVVLRCLRKDPDERFQTAQAMADALEPFDLDGLGALVLDEVEADDAPASPTVSVSSGQVVAASRAEHVGGLDTLLPTTRRRSALEATEGEQTGPAREPEPAPTRRPARPERRAWLVIAAATLVGAGVLVALTRGSDPRGSTVATAPTHVDDPPPESRAIASTGDAPPPARDLPSEPSLAKADLGSADLGSADLGSANLGSADTGSADTGSADTDALVIEDELTTGIPEGPEEGTDDEGGAGDDGAGDGGAGDGGASNNGTGAHATNPSRPPPTPPGTIRVGGWLTLEKPGPSGTHADARAYCKNLGKQRFVGVKGWTLAGPQAARRLAAYVKRGKYWTTALWNGKALVLDLPSKQKSSLAAEKKGPRALCVAKWP